MEGDTLINSDSGSFDSLTFFPSADSRLSKKRSFEQLGSTIDSSSTAPTTTPASSSALAEKKDTKDKKKRKVSFMIDDEDKEKEKVNNAPEEKRLSAEEIEEMKRKAEQWWNLPAGTSQEEFDNALANFKEGKYFTLLMEIEWIDVLLQRACARVVSLDQFSDAAQDLCAAIHAAMTRNDTELLKKLAHGDAELLSLTKQYTEDSTDLLVARQELTDKFGVIHSAKIAIKSEVYVSSATRLKQAGKEVTDAAVEEELAAFERGVVTVPGSGGGGCVMGYSRSTSPSPGASGGCPVRHQPDAAAAAAASDPQSPRPPQEEPRVCPYTGHKASTSGDEGRHAHEEALGGGGDAAMATTTTTTTTGTASTSGPLPGVCPYKAPTSGDEGRQAREEQEHQEDEPPHERSTGGEAKK